MCIVAFDYAKVCSYSYEHSNISVCVYIYKYINGVERKSIANQSIAMLYELLFRSRDLSPLSLNFLIVSHTIFQIIPSLTRSFIIKCILFVICIIFPCSLNGPRLPRNLRGCLYRFQCKFSFAKRMDFFTHKTPHIELPNHLKHKFLNGNMWSRQSS